MKQITLILFLNLLLSPAFAQQDPAPGSGGFDPFHFRNEFLMTSPGAMGFGLYGHANPAILNYVTHPDITFAWSDNDMGLSDFSRWGVFVGMPNTGFAVHRFSLEGNALTDYRLSTAFGNKRFASGLSVNWSGGDTDFFGRETTLTLGNLFRPSKYLSVGLMGTFLTDFDDYEGVVDLAVRPFGNERLAVFGDYALRKDMDVGDGMWSAGVAVEALPGLRFTGRYFDHEAFTFGVQLSLGRIGFSAQGGFDDSFSHSHNTYAVRVGAYDRNVIDERLRDPAYFVELDLSKPMRYQRYRLFDNANSLRRTLDAIDAAAEDPRVSGLAINASGMSLNPAMLWEVREQLQTFRETGKQVIVFTDNVSMNQYHLISVADHIVMDPQGSLTIPGYMMGNVYLNDLLQKLGIGVDEWRYHEYKSGFEALASNRMSDEDREQRQLLVDNMYALAKEDITASRGISDDEYERLVNDVVFFTAANALENGLVDFIGRWNGKDDIIEELTGKEADMMAMNMLQRYHLPRDNYWGRKPEVAVIYAEGPVDMDAGMRARSLAEDVKKARKDNNVKAIVFRVESPGGSPLASDVLAEQLLLAKEDKPVLISQGALAASGGYWLSMYGDTIVAAPNTITGSIGVIAGFFYDEGIKERVGYETDFVKQGDMAAMGFGIPVPLLGIPIMDKPFDDKEEELVRSMIGGLYDTFVKEVAESRGMTFEETDRISRGRVWSGRDAKEIGLVDAIGGLQHTIDMALEASGIGVDGDYEIVEYPEPGLFGFSGLASRLLGVESKKSIEDDPAVKHIIWRAKNQGKPMLILPMEYMHDFLYAE